MKKRFRFPLFLLALLALFASCSRTASFTIDQGGYRNKKTGVIYMHASDNYRAWIYFEDNLVGTYSYRSQNVKLKRNFYLMEGADGTLMDGVLTDENCELYLAPDASLPALSDFSLASAKLCRSDAITVPIREFDANDAERFRNAVLNGTSFSYELVDQSAFVERYELLLLDRELPVLYRLIYLEFSEDLVVSTDDGDVNYGSQFLYDRSIKTCYPIEKLTSESAS